MATLVLTVVGGILGGPIGAAIGAIAGQQVDQRLFAPKGREGPRLSDLTVQTSSYGSALPLLFGAVRVSGTVIWATDLREERTRVSTGKGRPKQTVYSYSASFAVALSARKISRVGRIWADGKLLRGAAGDFKVETGFRLYTGGEIQTPDPLIAAAEGDAPAFRGLAYAVFEDMQLATFGDRIPSLSFEVFADEAAISTGAIVSALIPGSVTDAPTMLQGFVANGTSIRGVIAALDEAVPLLVRRDPLALTITEAPSAGLGPNSKDFGLQERPPQRERRSISRLPSSRALSYFEPTRDYQAGLQRAWRRDGGAGEERAEIAATLTSDVAHQLSERGLSRSWADRNRVTVDMPWRQLTIAPGQAVALPGLEGNWRARAARLESMRVTVELTPLAADVPASTGFDPGQFPGQPDFIHGPTTLAVADLPFAQQGLASSPIVVAAAAGVAQGWRSAVLSTSFDDGMTWQDAGPTASPAIIGTALAPLSAAWASGFDRASILDVMMLNPSMALQSASEDAVLAGTNLAMLGKELSQFSSAVLLAPGQYRLTGLLRGRKGTEWAMNGHVAGEVFLLLAPETLAPLSVPAGCNQLRVMAQGVGDGTSAAESMLDSPGAAMVPPSPVGLEINPAGGGALLTWIRRSRDGWNWIDGVDAPLAEEQELYSVRVAPSGLPVREVQVASPSFFYSAADQAADSLAGASNVTFSVWQAGTHGLSQPATLNHPLP